MVIAATDGLFDNLYEQEITAIVSKSLQAGLKTTVKIWTLDLVWLQLQFQFLSLFLLKNSNFSDWIRRGWRKKTKKMGASNLTNNKEISFLLVEPPMLFVTKCRKLRSSWHWGHKKWGDHLLPEARLLTPRLPPDTSALPEASWTMWQQSFPLLRSPTYSLTLSKRVISLNSVENVCVNWSPSLRCSMLQTVFAGFSRLIKPRFG